MLDYTNSEFGGEHPDEDTTTHYCGCDDPGCAECNPHPGATAPAWWLAQPQPGEDDDNALPF